MRFINIWFGMQPEDRDEFLAFFRPLVPWIRAREGVLYFEMGPRDGDPAAVIVSECLADDAVHAAMWATPEFDKVSAMMQRLGVRSRADVHYADFVRTELWGIDPPDAQTGRLPPQLPSA